MSALPPLDEPPPRRAWEEPPPDGWSSNLEGVGAISLRVIASVFVAAATLELAWTAHTFPHHRTGERHGVWIFLWCTTGVLGACLAAYLWRRMRGLFIIGAMLTDYGRVARFGGRPPVWLDAPPEVPALKIVHLSDLHLVEAPTVRMIEQPQPGGNACLPQLLDAPELADAELLLFTGDLTDRGTSLSWRCFLDAIEERRWAERVVLVPGNHDLAYVERESSWRQDRFGVVQLANLLKFAEAFAATRGGQRGSVILDEEVRPFSEVWETIERQVRPLVAGLPTTPVPPLTLRNFFSERRPFDAYVAQIEAARERLLALFPVAVPVGRDGVLFVINSSAAPQFHPATNALGHVGRAQYRRLDRLAEAFSTPLKLVALHHHVVRRAEEMSTPLRARVLAKFTVLHDPRPLVRFCRAHRVRAVFNGHRHLSYQLRLDSGTVILAAPSSTLGDELAEDPRPQFERYDFAGAAEGSTVGIWREVVRPRPSQVVVATSLPC